MKHHIHDKLFKMVFSQKKEAVSFLESCLPTRTLDVLDLNSLFQVDGNFVDKEFVETHADLLFKIDLRNGERGYIYILSEHKSSPDRNASFQLLKYMVRIWAKHIEENKTNILPHIIQILFFHGKKAWPWEPALGSQFKPIPELERYVPHFVFDLHDLSTIPDNQIMGNVVTSVVQEIFKYIHHPKKLESRLELLLKLLHKETGMEYIEVILRYIAYSVNRVGRDLVRIIAKTIPEGEKLMSTFAQELRNEGKLEGRLEGTLYGIEALLDVKFGKAGLQLLDKIRQINDPEKLKAILTKIKLATSLDELDKQTFH